MLLLITAITACVALSLYPANTLAHASEQGFVLLLPTDIYITSGVAVLVASVLLLAFTPKHITERLFQPVMRWDWEIPRSLTISLQLVSGLFLLILIVAGFTGTNDPLKNLLSLSVWTVWWVGCVILQGVTGAFWQTVNPFAGLHQLLPQRFRTVNRSLPEWATPWIAAALLLIFGAFYLVDPVPADPTRLAVIVSVYTVLTLAGMVLFGGQNWLNRCEFITVLMLWYGKLSPVQTGKSGGLGFPGWALFNTDSTLKATTVCIVILLGTGSFDGLNETFWWLHVNGINPLAFPGRSAIVWQNTLGLVLANALLFLVLYLCVSWGHSLACKRGDAVTDLTRWRLVQVFLPAVLPIAFVYHFAHFLPSFMVDIQYVAVAISSPFGHIDDWLGLGDHYVSTGFFNTRDSVRVIWLSQAGAVVAGHVLGVLISHSAAVKLYNNHRTAVWSQVPLVILMVLYTYLGLWLLAAPRGL